MPKFIQVKTIEKVQHAFITKSRKAIGCVMPDGKIKFYPAIDYNLKLFEQHYSGRIANSKGFNYWGCDYNL